MSPWGGLCLGTSWRSGKWILWKDQIVEVKELLVSQIERGEHEERFDYEGDEFEDLVASISRDGVLEPLIVKVDGDRFVLVNGHRRLRACERLGIGVVPCKVQEGDAATMARVEFVVNLFRKDPTPVELAVRIAKAAESGSIDLAELAKGLQRSTEWVKRQMAMLEWPEDVLRQIHAGKISVSAAANLARVTDEAYRRFLLGNAVVNGATARTTAAWLQQWEAGQPAAVAVEAEPVEGQAAAVPMVPQGPCLCCKGIHRTDEMSHVPLCARCIQRVMHLSEG